MLTLVPERVPLVTGGWARYRHFDYAATTPALGSGSPDTTAST